MKVVLSALAILALVSAGPTHSAEESPRGRLQVVNTVGDAGNVVRGQEARVTFLLKNVGSGDLKILSAKPSCGCTVASFDPVIAPGKEGKVEAVMRTETFRGPVEKAVTLSCDDPAAPSTQLRIKANVVGSVVVLPRPALAFPTPKTWQYTGRLLVRKDETESGTLDVTGLKTSAPWLQASAQRVQEGDAVDAELPDARAGDFILEVSVGEDAPKSHEPQSLEFKTGLPREPGLTIPVSVVLDAPLRVTPSPLLLRSPNEGSQERIGVLSAVLRPGLANEKLTAVASPDPFAIRVEPVGTREYRAVVTWKPGGPEAPKDGNVILRVGDESLTVLVRTSEPESAAPAPPAALRP